MTNPTINGQTLSTGGTHTTFGQPQVRMTLSSLPSVDGAFASQFGKGPQMIYGRGALSAASHLLLKAALRTIQNAAGHAPATYTDGDGSTHDNCILLSYEPVGDVQRESATSFWTMVRWTIFKQVAD